MSGIFVTPYLILAIIHSVFSRDDPVFEAGFLRQEGPCSTDTLSAKKTVSPSACRTERGEQ